jgi:phosphoribosylformylglycinamidine (FGAM) synthase-like enzyme
VAMVGLIADAHRVARMGLTKSGQQIFLLGGGQAQLDGSEYLATRHRRLGQSPPPIDLEGEKALADLVVGLIEAGLVAIAHDVSDGGIAVALAEMAMAGAGCGCDVTLAADRRRDRALFGESGCRMLLAVDAEHAEAVSATAERAGVALLYLGKTAGTDVVIRDAGGAVVVRAPLTDLRTAWEETLPHIADGSFSGR